jgi:hypothetical protein
MKNEVNEELIMKNEELIMKNEELIMNGILHYSLFTINY